MTDIEQIKDGGILGEINELSNKIAEKGELDNQIKNISNLSDALIRALDCTESRAAKGKIDDVNAELSNLRHSINSLAENMAKYHKAAEDLKKNTLSSNG